MTPLDFLSVGLFMYALASFQKTTTAAVCKSKKMRIWTSSISLQACAETQIDVQKELRLRRTFVSSPMPNSSNADEVALTQ